MYLFKYNHYFEYYIVDGHYYIINFFYGHFSQTEFSIVVIFDWLISLYFFLTFTILLWVQISMNHILPHPITMIMLISYITLLFRKEKA